VTTGSNRDRLLERHLRRAFRSGAAAPVTDACLDAERLAAWIDGGLDSRGAEAIERHVSSCARCQALVGVMARTEPLEPVQTAWWRRWPAWAIPLTAGAAAALVWMAGPGERVARQPDKRAAAPVAIAQAPAEVALAPPAAAQGGRAAAPVGAAPEATVRPPASASAQLGAGEKSEAAASAASPLERRTDVDAPGADRAAARLASRAEPAAVPPPSQAQALGRIEAAEAPAIEIPSPDAGVRWRLTAAGVDRTTDGGASWEALATGESARLVAGSAPSPDVCWLVGRGGTVLLATDGRTWRRVPFPEPVDLVGVQSADARTAVVTAADGRVFRTNDAGATWAPQ
jgi:hypothetical protein